MVKNQLALIMVNIQRDFWRPLEKKGHFPLFPENVRTLLATAREQGLTVVHTQAIFQPDGSDWMLFFRPEGRGNIPCIAGTDGVAFEEFAVPVEGEPVIQKQHFDGFVQTDLEQVLRDHNIKAVLVAGLETSVCVLFTATAAYLKRFVPIVVSDACADEVDKHEATPRMYNGLCFQTVTTEQVQSDFSSIVLLAERFMDNSPTS